MAARAMWKGVLRLDREAVPVKLYAAVRDRNIHFQLLHDQDMVKVKQRMVHSETGKAVPTEEIQKGFQLDRDQFVLLNEEELESLEPEPSRDITVTRIVSDGTIHHQWYDRPYFLGPDEHAEDDYFACVQALKDMEAEGIAQWVMRKKQYVGALRVEGDYLMLLTLRHAGEVISASDLEFSHSGKLDSREQKMAEQLVSAYAGDFDPSEYRDEYHKRVTQLIELKKRGGKIDFPEYQEPVEPDSLSEMLQASLQEVGD